VVVALHLVYVVSQYSYFMWFLFGFSHDHNIVSHDYNKLHKYVQVQLLYVVGAECISLYLGSTKIQQSRPVVFGDSGYPAIPIWWPPQCMQAPHLPLFVPLISRLYSFFLLWHSYLMVFLHVHILCVSLLLKLNNFCIDRQICRPLLVKMVCCWSNIMLLVQICISYWSFLILCCWSNLISWM